MSWFSLSAIAEKAKSLANQVKETAIAAHNDFQEEAEKCTAKEAKAAQLPLPWEQLGDSLSSHEDRVKDEIGQLAMKDSTFLDFPPEGTPWSFELDEAHIELAQRLIAIYPTLRERRFKLVRRIRTKGHVTEKDFWSNFFFHIKLVKDSMRRFQSLGDLVTELPDTIDKEGAEASGDAAVVAADTAISTTSAATDPLTAAETSGAEAPALPAPIIAATTTTTTTTDDPKLVVDANSNLDMVSPDDLNADDELGMEEFVSEDVMFDNEEENAAIMDELKRELGLDD